MKQTSYPNPLKDIVTISSLTGKNELRLLDRVGQSLTTVQTTDIVQQSNLGKYPSGIYMLQVMQNNTIVQNIKLIKK